MRLAVVGGGAWGTALGAHLAHVGHEVRLWARAAPSAREINERHRLERYLPGVDLPAALRATDDLGAALQGAATAFVAIPSEFCRARYRRRGAPAARRVCRWSRPPRGSSWTRCCA